MRIYLDGKIDRAKIQYEECERDTIQVEDGPGPKPIPEAITLTETDVGFGRPLRDFLEGRDALGQPCATCAPFGCRDPCRRRRAGRARVANA